MKEFKFDQLLWVREPKEYDITEKKIVIKTEPWTDLWQRTYYGFQHDSAPLLLMDAEESIFTFTVKANFDCRGLFEQCGIVIYLDSDNWMKASMEYENVHNSKLGCVVTNEGYSDWSSTDVSSDIHEIFFRLSRRDADYLVETSEDGVNFKQLRMFHLKQGAGNISFGLYACSPLDSSFRAEFSEIKLSDCTWEAFHM